MKQKYLGYEFREAIATACHKICADLNLRPVTVTWIQGMTTAAINASGDIYLSYVRDDAIMTHAEMMRYAGFVVHELLHRKFTDFGVKSGNQYVDQLHNALEDARIEHMAIRKQLTGNITELLTRLIDGMVAEALSESVDWSRPEQYPFLLAVYTRQHAARKIPLPFGLAQIFDEAAIRLGKCTSSADAMMLAQWVYKELQSLPQPKGAPQNKAAKGAQKGAPSPSEGPASPSNQSVKGEGAAQANSPAEAPRGSVARDVEPSIETPQEKQGGGYYSFGILTKPAHHVDLSNRRFPINF